MGRISIILPDFVIVGANKAGTTSVANYLTQHPEIKISAVKEPMFFSSDPYRASAKRSNATLGKPYFAITLDEYSSMFEDYKKTTRLFGEASTSYLAAPAPSSRLIRKIIPDAKIIAILREPASRAVSAYKMCFGNGIEQRKFSEIVKVAGDQQSILYLHGVKEYIRNGLYSQLLRPYLDLFDRSNLLFLKYDDLDNDPVTFMSRILKFICASPYEFQMDVRYNTAQDNVKAPLVIDVDDLQKLRHFYQEDIIRTQEMTGLDLSDWLIV